MATQETKSPEGKQKKVKKSKETILLEQMNKMDEGEVVGVFCQYLKSLSQIPNDQRQKLLTALIDNSDNETFAQAVTAVMPSNWWCIITDDDWEACNVLEENGYRYIEPCDNLRDQMELDSILQWFADKSRCAPHMPTLFATDITNLVKQMEPNRKHDYSYEYGFNACKNTILKKIKK